MYVDGAVIKIASRCNLNCSYCYMYNKGDETYKLQPKNMNDSVVDSFVKKVSNYVEKYNKEAFIFVFHGGEPLLAGQDFFKSFVSKAKETIKCKLEFVVQTNGVLIDSDWVKLFNDLEIIVGISLDGTKGSNDEFRIFHNGKSAYEEIVKGLNLTINECKKKPGVLSVMDYSQDPVEVYSHLKSLKSEGVNLLFPDDTYDDDFEDDLSLGKWLSTIYDLWVQDDRKLEIEQFQKLKRLIMGVPNVHDEYYGLGRPNTFILETDGEIQPNDPLRVCKNGFTKTPLNIKENEIDDLFALPLSFLYYNNHQNLCKKCQECDLVSVCGGGYIINRYSSKNGFDNPSIFCKSLAYFITHVQNHITDMVGSEITNECEVEKLKWDEVEEMISGNQYERTPFLESFA